MSPSHTARRNRSRGHIQRQRTVRTHSTHELIHYEEPERAAWVWAIGLGRHAWNQLVAHRAQAMADTDAHPGPDLREADLRGADLRGYDLTDARLEDARLNDAKLQGAVLDRANLRRANLSGADLTGAQLVETRLANARLGGVDLSGAHLVRCKIYVSRRAMRQNGLILSGTRFTECRILGWHLEGVIADTVRFEQCLFSHWSPWGPDEDGDDGCRRPVQLSGEIRRVELIDCKVHGLQLDLGADLVVHQRGEDPVYMQIVQAATLDLDRRVPSLSVLCWRTPGKMRIPPHCQSTWTAHDTGVWIVRLPEGESLGDWRWTNLRYRAHQALEKITKGELAWWIDRERMES